MGLTRPRVETLMQGHEVYLANLNAETQFVIAGRDEAMAEVAQLALRAGASKAQRLAVSVPSHCALLDKPAAELAKAFAGASLRRPWCAYLSGSTARVWWDPQRIADDLAMNMARPVHWQEAMVAADERDARRNRDAARRGAHLPDSPGGLARGDHCAGAQRPGRRPPSGAAA